VTDAEREALIRQKSAEAPHRHACGSPESVYYNITMIKFHWERMNDSLKNLTYFFDELVEENGWSVVPTYKPYGTVDSLFQAEFGTSYDHMLDMTLDKIGPYPEGLAKAAEEMATDEIVDLIGKLQGILKERGPC
jgi:hypothetical protein